MHNYFQTHLLTHLGFVHLPCATLGYGSSERGNRAFGGEMPQEWARNEHVSVTVDRWIEEQLETEVQ